MVVSLAHNLYLVNGWGIFFPRWLWRPNSIMTIAGDLSDNAKFASSQESKQPPGASKTLNGKETQNGCDSFHEGPES